MNAFRRIYRGGADDIEGRGIVTFLSSVVGEVDTSREIATSGILGILIIGVSEVGKEDIEESLEMEILSSSISAAEVSDSASASGVLDFSRVRVRPRLSCLSRVKVRRRAFRTGATGVVIVSGLAIETSSSEVLSSSPLAARFGYKNCRQRNGKKTIPSHTLHKRTCYLHPGPRHL